ncbi:20S proteasome subunit beta 6 [Enteropsectra breve]|nr:20S proteasome subunit beta 6 [Enteropsectra breve]
MLEFSLSPKNNISIKKKFDEDNEEWPLNETPEYGNFHLESTVLQNTAARLIFKQREGIKKHAASEEDLYENNGGTSLALIVENKLILASDTRHSSEYNINSRNMTKIYRIGDFFITTAGFYADGFEIYNQMMYNIRSYETDEKLTLSGAAHLLHNLLYRRRFFPLYSYVCLCGFEKGEAKIYSYDCIGSYGQVECRCDGSGSKMIQPLLDSWIEGGNFVGFKKPDFNAAYELVKKAFDAASERDVKTKDYLELYVVDESQVHHEYIELRKD